MNPPAVLYVPTSSPMRPVRVSPEDYYALMAMLETKQYVIHIVGRGQTTAAVISGPDKKRQALSRWVYERAHGVELGKKDLIFRVAKGDQFLYTRDNLSLVKVGECKWSRPKKLGCAPAPPEYWTALNSQSAQ